MPKGLSRGGLYPSVDQKNDKEHYIECLKELRDGLLNAKESNDIDAAKQYADKTADLFQEMDECKSLEKENEMECS